MNQSPLDAIEELLAVPHSRVSDYLRVQLVGVRASLRSVLESQGDDPGAQRGWALLRRLEALDAPGEKPVESEGSSQSMFSDWEASPQPSRSGVRSEQGDALQLEGLWEEASRDPSLVEILGERGFRCDDDCGRWREFHVMTLRVNAKDAQRLRSLAADHAQKIGSRLGGSYDSMAFDIDAELVPALEGALSVKGLKASANEPLSSSSPTCRETLYARWAGFLFSMLERDPDLRCAVKNVWRFEPRPLDSTMADRYEDELNRRLRALDEARGTAAQVRARVALDESLASMVHCPIVSADSFWGAWVARMRAHLFKTAKEARGHGCEIVLRELSGRFQDVRGLVEDSLAMEGHGAMGQILRCLRVYSEIEDQTHKGRVIYRGL